ncbi:asparagine synthase-related protein [Dyella sp. 2HG41-7]|uniref:asparagine synthase-related protein n=1 Tax=Dyella sp. 2HG41-7 TaxID=2883239 RepID=UPI001F2E3141|nr:asparagine synthase-related protein [Dyella sp. 2HG41-7]
MRESNIDESATPAAGFPLHSGASAPSNFQINTSPYLRDIDFSPLDRLRGGDLPIDPVSLADLMRLSFVYPPHSIFQNVKLAGTGFDPTQDMHSEPLYHYEFQSAKAPARPLPGSISDKQLLDTYHRLLCDAISRATANMRAPWLFQSGGKDSTVLAIALAETRPDTACFTYLGGPEENEVPSAQIVAKKFGLRHEALVCDPERAYDRYLALVPRIPLLTADFATLSYVDLATEVRARRGDGIIDGLGADEYFGAPLHARERMLALLARGIRLPKALFTSPLARNNFKFCFVLSTLQMNAFERFFPGSRFSDTEVDALFGCKIADRSRDRLKPFRSDIDAARSQEGERRIALTIVESGQLAKCMYIAKAMSLRLTFPYCDERLRDWIFHHVPDADLIGPGSVNKVLMRKYIAQHFEGLPYVQTKGCFRFDLRGLASRRYDQVYAFAEQARDVMPGATSWLDAHHRYLDNKFFASKFYLLAVTLPWLLSRTHGPAAVAR